MEALANLNGKQMPLNEVMIPALDRGFLFGDAVYEVLRIYAGKSWLLDEHMKRLGQSLASIRIAGVDLKRLQDRLLATIAAGPFAEAIAYIQITRGAGTGRTHTFPANATPLEFLFVQAFEDTYESARRDGVSALTQPDIRWDRCDIKSTNLLANVLAAQAAKEADCAEVLYYMPDGTLTEGCRTSFFGVLDGKLLTAPNSTAILPGITRGLVLRLAERSNISVREHDLKRDDLSRVSELFLTGTTSEILPTTSVDNKPIADGRPGPVTQRLQEAYSQAVREHVG